MKKLTKALSILLSFALVLSLMPGVSLTALAAGSSTSTLNFTSMCYGSGTADDGVAWTVTSDGQESTFSSVYGIHYGTNSKAVQYIKLSTSSIPGTITSIKVNASTASNATASVSVTVGGEPFGGDPRALSKTATDYTFTGSGAGEILVTVSKPESAYKALYVKSIAVTYSTSPTVAVTGVTLDKTTAQSIAVGGSVAFTATVAPDNATDKTVVWSVGGTNADAVKLYTDADCTAEVGAGAVETMTVYAKGISAGSATVTATSNADATKSASCNVTVEEAAATTYTVTFTDTLGWGDIHVYYWDNGPEWPGVAMEKSIVNEYGQQVYTAELPTDVKGIIFNGNGDQTVDITTGISNGAQWYPVNEKEGFGYKVELMSSSTVNVESVTLAPEAAQTIDVGGKVSFTATVAPDNATDKSVKWSVSGDAVKLYSDADCTAEVGAGAVETLTVYAKGISASSATITATSNADSEKKASCDVTVNAAQTQNEELLTTITATGTEQASYSVANVATVSFSNLPNYGSHYTANWGWWGTGWSATVTPADGYTITKCVFYDNIDNNATDSEAPFVVETAEDDKIPKVNGSYIYPYSTSAGVKKIEVYGYATPAPALDPVSYMAWNGTTLVEKTGDDACTDYTVVTADTTTFEDGKWYVVSNSVTVSSRITVTGTANLILCDGATLTASKGITVNSGNTINIYAQSEGTGVLSAGNTVNAAGIGGGGRGSSSGTVNIHGGIISATGGSTSAGIGGALEGGNGEVNIYGGEVTAQGQNFAAGIGGYSGKSGGTVNIYGGTVNASGSKYGTTGIGIGGTEPGNCVVHIYGGEVTATSEKAAAGIQGTVTIDGGTVTANGGGDSNSIDCNSGETYSSNGINGTVTINGGTVTATGGNVTVTGYMSAIESSRGGTIYACSGISGTVTISGGTVTATGGNVTGEISNRGGNIYACNGIGGTVTISGGTVTATGGSHTGNSSGTAVKEKGFGGSLTLGTGMYLYGGTSANPESNLSNHVPQNNGDYARSRYMTVNNVAPHTHSFTYSATGATITATCTAGCDITEGLALTISAPTELTYDGSAKAATLSTGYNTTAFPGEYMIKYYKGANEVEAANVKAAGDYTAKVTVGEATASVDFTIAKATPSIETIPTASAITYGQKLADSALTGGAAKRGDTTVAGTFAWKSAETKPSVSDSNTTEYAVMFNPTDTDNYAAVECKVKLTVNRAEPTVTVPTAKTPTYNGSAHELVNAGSATGGTMYYAVTTENTAPTDASLYATSIPSETNAGTYYVWYKVVGDSNHNDTEPASVTVTISMATPTLTEPTLEAVTYDPSKTLANIALTGGWTWVTGTTVPTVGNTGYTAVISVDDANYVYSAVTGYDSAAHNVTRTLALTVNKATVTAPTIESKTYNAQTQTADVTESTLYTVTANNGGTEAGDYNVVLALTDAANYKWSDSDEAEKTLIFSIAKATNNTVSLSIEGWTYGDAANAPTAASDFGTPVITYAVKDSGEFNNEVPTDAGDYTVKATVAETANYKGGEATADFTISPKTLTITAEAKSKTYGEADPALTYTHSDLVGSDTITGALTRTVGENFGDYAINQGTLDAGANYAITYNSANLTINKKALTITAGSAEKVYDATALTKNTANDYTNTELAFNDAIESVTITGSQTVKGESSNVPSAAVIKNGNGDNVTANYNITYTNGTLKVTAKPITITADSDTKIYDATALTKNSYTNTDLAEGDTITSVTITGTQTNVGESTNVPSAAVIKHGGTDVTASYAITYVNGTLEVTPKAVTITANDKTKVYDGTALTEGGFTATALASTDSHTFTVAMTSESAITNFGTQPNVIATVDGTAITTGTPTAVGNYLVTTVDGALSITKLEIKGAIVKLDAFEYDTAVPTAEFINDSTVAGANGTIVEGDETKSVTYYYQATAFLKSQTDDIEALADTEGVFAELKATTFEPGKHYVLAVVTGDNYTDTYITQSVFEVKKNTEKVRDADITAPEVDGTKVTVDEADRAKSLEYSLDGTTWKPVTLGENGEFTAEWANPVTEAELKLRETADESYAKPSASVAGTKKITTTTFTVAYDANGGVKAPDAVTVTSDRTATVSGKANMTRKGYTFKAWNTKADGNGTEVKAGDKLESGTTLYAQWEANTYKVSFSANGGTGTMEKMSFTYDEAKTLTANGFTREGYEFLGWSLTANGGVQYQDKQNVKNLTESGTVTLYAVWAKELYNINGTIKSAQTGDITLQLVQGSIAFGKSETVEYTTAETEVNFTLNGVPAGTYNLVATQGDVTMTAAVLITDDHVALELIEMPSGSASSVIDIKSVETPAIVVGGLDELAENEIVEDRKVKVAIAIEAQNETQAGEAGEAIVKESRAQNSEFIDFTVTKTITNKNVEESVETMTETSNVLELVIPFNFSGKTGIKLYRFHDGVEALKQAKGDEVLDGTYSLNQKAGAIHVYASKFSTYAITYSNFYPASDFEPVIKDTEHGTVTVEPQKAQAGKEVVITATPDASYKLGELTVTDGYGKKLELTENEDGTFSFKQPSGKVTVEAKFNKEVKFVDVSENSYYAKAVDWAVENEITNGVDDTHFAPDATCTRAQAVTFLWRALGCPEPTSTKSEFTDVAEGAFYFKAVLWAAENGVTNGYGDGTFGVNDTVNRGQMVTFMERAMKGKAKTAESFTDVPEGAYYADAAAWAKENGISNGIGGNMFGSNENCARAQIVTMLYRYFVK